MHISVSLESVDALPFTAVYELFFSDPGDQCSVSKEQILSKKKLHFVLHPFLFFKFHQFHFGTLQQQWKTLLVSITRWSEKILHTANSIKVQTEHGIETYSVWFVRLEHSRAAMINISMTSSLLVMAMFRASRHADSNACAWTEQLVFLDENARTVE